MPGEIESLATLLRVRNVIDEEIAGLIKRPPFSGHIAEFIAASVFDIDLHASAAHKASDGVFRSGPFAGKSVNVKFVSLRENSLDLVRSQNPEDHPDLYLVLAGPKSQAGSSKGLTSPWVVTEVFVIESGFLLSALKARGLMPGTATSIITRWWEESRVYPVQGHAKYVLSEEQSDALRLFSSGSM